MLYVVSWSILFLGLHVSSVHSWTRSFHEHDLLTPSNNKSTEIAASCCSPKSTTRILHLPPRRLSDDEPDDDDDDDDDDEPDDESEDESDDEGESSFDGFEDIAWLVHGGLMILSWGVFAPLAIGGSLLRRIIGETWFKIHLYTQILVLVLSSVGFGLAIINVHFDDDEHFDETHKQVGLTIYILLIIQVCSGLFRPHAPHGAPVKDDEGSSTREQAVDEDSTAEDTVASPLEKKTMARLFFEVQHRILGAGLVLLSWFNCSTGIQEVFEENLTPLIVFWAVAGGIAIVVSLLRLTVQCKPDSSH